MRKSLLGALALTMGLIFQVSAQKRNCAAQEVLEQQLQNDPEFAQRQAALEKHTREFTKAFKEGRVEGQNIVIPCVVQVVYSNSQENISLEQIQSQIDRLNEDYSATNSDYGNAPTEFQSVRSGDTGIRFELIEVKRFSNSRTSWGTNDAVKSAYPPVEPSRILNMWVCNIGNSILGYAQFPGGSPATDGVVMSPQFFGDASKGSGFYLNAPFNRGRTATHEVGHWLNLRHIWGDGNCSADDFVNDTPVSGNPNYGCPSYPTNSCSSSGNDMTMNYMDYVDDACMYMFSIGQDARMQATFANGGGREGFLLDPTYSPGGGSGGGSSCSNTEVTLALTFDQYPSETTWTIKDANGSTVASGNGSGASANSSTSETFCLADGDYTFTINDSYGDGICCSYGNGSYDLSAGSTTYASGGSFGSTESTSFSIGSGGGSTGPAPAPTGYCASKGNDSSYEWIDLVQVGSINNSSSDDGGYADNTSQSTDLTIGGSATITFSAGFQSSSYTEHWAVYIDLNRDGDFNDSGERLVSGSSSSSGNLTATLNIPSSASAGLTRMRVSMKYNASQTPCETFNYGEVEDYTVNLTGTTRTSAAVARGSVSETLGTESNTANMTLYPNPAAEVLNVQLRDAEGTTVNVYSISGQLVKTVSLASEAKIDISSLNRGIYLLKATNDNGVFTQRFSKR